MEKCIIVAVADNWAIGKNNDLLWHLPNDLKYFKKTTMGCPVIMGYMTFKSLNSRPLPGRTNIVISIFPWYDAPENIVVVDSLEKAYEEAEKVCDGSENAPDKCFVMGGGYTYAEAMQYSDALYITHVHDTVPDAEIWFPEVDENIWKKDSVSETYHDEKAGVDYEFVIYRRK